jgi:3-hydroxyacyl-CoA dehydrogenase/enoyl-CoA hydratase/3-hydroxybutyryl-CoA epimerase
MNLATQIASAQSASTKPSVTLESKDGIAWVTIDVADSKVNVLGMAAMAQLNDIVDRISSEKNIRAMLIVSGKDDFISGADVKQIQAIQQQTQMDAYEASQLGKQILLKMDRLPIRVVAAINGLCLGGGTEVTLACDYRLASPKVKIGLPEIMLGFIPGWGGCVRLPRLVGVATAVGLILAGQIIDAKKAWKIGLVDEVVEGDLRARAAEVANGAEPHRSSRSVSDIAMQMLLETNPLGLDVIRSQSYKAMMRATKGKYPAPKEALNVIFKGLKLPEEKAYELESRGFSKLALTEVSKNLVRIFFAQTESKKLPAEIKEKPDVKTVGVLGAGVMGAGIAQAAAKAGYKVVVKDVEQKFLDKGKDTISGLFGKLVERKKMSREEADRIVGSIVFTTSYADMADCDLIIEAVIEDLKVKQEALAQLDQVITKPYAFATNTSSLSVSRIAEGTKDPGKVAGLHFFNPVHKMPLVEIIRGERTSDAALAAAMSVALKMNRTATDAFVVAKDAPGFVVNRILAPYMREAAVLASEGVPVEDIDKAMKSFGMPMGPFTLMDEIGLDVCGKVLHVMESALGDRMSAPPLMSDIEKLKLLGKKGGKGIFLYDSSGKPVRVKVKKKKGMFAPTEMKAVINPEVQALLTAKVNKKAPSEIQDRLVLLMLNEAARCIEEKVVAEPGQLDLALIFGTGFPPFLGGVLRFADAQGIDVVYKKLLYLSRVQGQRYEPCKLLADMDQERRTFYREKRS